ncbi:MAG TPA: putative Ig domain-containing protein, partial [Bryobacteraceae bacterium]|nr:putative Ig domain-containing protein [Bryobacteraceae bacterium]
MKNLFALALLSVSVLPGAVSEVKLSPSASPGAADPGVTAVTITGHGFPPGTIPAANVTVTFQPIISGSGPSGSATATRVTVVSGSTEHVSFKVPVPINVPVATPYQVSIAGTTSTGKRFSSSNTASLTINAPVSISTGSSLPIATVGVNYSLTLSPGGGTGQYTWTISSGSLPGGLSLNAATGQISGQPTAAGAPGFTVQLTDSDNASTSKAFSITVDPALLITTSSPLTTGTVSVNYSAAITATGGSGQYTWSVSQGTLPAGLTLTAATGQISGQPATAGAPNFTIQVTDSNQVSANKAFSVTIDPALVITSISPLPVGEVGISYSDSLGATGGSGKYAWSVSAGSLPGGLSLAAATGLLSGIPATAITANFTIQVTDTNQVTVTQPVTLTINPAAQIQSLAPVSADAGLSLQVTITGSNTHFVQGTTQASFGPGVSVASLTVGSPTTATAQISISASAATGSQSVTVTTGAEQATLSNGFTISPAVPIINVNTTAATPLAPGFSGFDDEYLIHGVEYWDPKYLAMVQPLKPGWVRYPAGTPSMAFDWQAAHLNLSWIG